MNLNDVYHQVQGGGSAVIFLLLLFTTLWFTRRLLLPAELDNEMERRKEEVAYRDTIIERQNEVLDREQALFQQALDTIRADILPLVQRLTTERR